MSEDQTSTEAAGSPGLTDSGREDHATEFTSLQLRRAQGRSIWESVFSALASATTMGAHVTGYLLRLGATPFQLGLMGAIPSLAELMQLAGSDVVERLRRRKIPWLLSYALARCIWVPFFCVPFLLIGFSSSARLWLVLGLMMVGYGCFSMALPMWFSWMADLVPSRVRGRFFGARFFTATLTAMIGSLAVGHFLDLFPKEDDFRGFAVIALAGVACGLASALIQGSMPEPAVKQGAERRSSFKRFLVPLRSSSFRPLLVFVFIFAFARLLIQPWATVFLLKHLKLPYLWIYGMLCLFQVTNALSARVWGRLQDRYGNRPVYAICACGFALLPIFWVICQNITWFFLLPVCYVIGGFLSGGFTLSQNNLMLSLSPREGRSAHVAVLYVIQGMGVALGTMTAAFLFAHWESIQFSALGLEFTPYHLIFLTTLLARMAALPLLRRIKEEGVASPGYVLRRFRVADPFFTSMHVATIAGAVSESRRLRAARGLGTKHRSAIAIEALVNALDDASEEVRVEAARSLGEIGDHEAIPPLVERLGSEDSHLRAASAEALGRIRRREGVEPLIERLQDEEKLVRGSAARALGEIRDDRAAEPLMDSLTREQDPFVFSSSAAALGKLGALRAIWTILPAFRDARQPLVRRQLANAIANLLGSEGEFYAIQAAEIDVPGSGVARIFERVRRRCDRAARRNKRFPRDWREMLTAIERAYDGERFGECTRDLQPLAQAAAMAGLSSAAEDFGPGDYESLLNTVAVARPKLGSNLWFVLLLNQEEHFAPELIRREEALLGIYALQQVIHRLIKGQKEEPDERLRRGPYG